ncbi:hypothetical protein CQJ94_28005 [Glycomyces fuscus]|nr:hypothetical protein CQJ94_28005 [Glycomyces fuscus]
MFLASAVLACVLIPASVRFSGHELRALGAAYGWTGQEGVLEVTESVPLGDGGSLCLGVFRPADDGPVRTGVHLYLSGPCEAGRLEAARLVPGEPTWMLTTEQDRAYADAGPGSGVPASILGFVLVNLFCLGLGLVFAQGALVLGTALLRRAWLRLRRDAPPKP